ncbi:Proteasome-activating nucleotidase [ANME-1 cluster archaeon GoMg2]|nr:Proteasome-activating nucleotidase [ANME-1 cluster archaeon GoMg2]
MNPLLEQEYLNKLKECKENAKKYYDSGDYEKASMEYLRCSKYCAVLVKKTEDETKKREYYDAFEKFVGAATKLKTSKTAGVSETKAEHQSGEAKTGFVQYIRDNVMRKEKESLPSWNDIGGLEEVKDLIKKSVVIGIIENKPKAIEAWNTILFYGPPGTGKTLMAAAVAKNIAATFFDVKVSQMLSKYYGESPKIMSALFEVAREEAPSVVFIDEFDSIALSRGANIDEESRRGLSTLLAELDGLGSKTSGKKFVLVIVATNTPDAIDEAIKSRFGKKIKIPLPDFEACKAILKIHTEKKGVGLVDESVYDKLAMYCVEHKKSGRDIKFLCTDAIGKMLDEMNPGLEKLAEEPYERIRVYELRTRSLREGDFGPNVFKGG